MSSILAVAACAGSPAAPQQADQEAKRFEPPPSDKGALYIYRSGLLGFARPIDVSIVGGAMAHLSYNTFVRIEGPPGPVEVGCRIGDNTGNGQVQIPDGQTRFIEVSLKMGLLLPGCDVAEVPPDVGQAAVRNARRLDSQ